MKKTTNKVEEEAHTDRNKPEGIQKVFKPVKCNLCTETYSRIIDLEIHIKNCHEEHQAYQCDYCEKTFTLRWRLRKHMRIHTVKNVKPCHYFNRNEKCPFNEFGCKFLHAVSNDCKLSQAEEESKLIETNVDDLENDSMNAYSESSLFKTSTPKKKRIQCSECLNKSQCTDCFVRQTLKLGHRVHFSEDC